MAVECAAAGAGEEGTSSHNSHSSHWIVIGAPRRASTALPRRASCAVEAVAVVLLLASGPRRTAAARLGAASASGRPSGKNRRDST